MSGSRNRLGFNLSTNTFSLLLAFFCTSRRFGSLPTIKTMTCSRHVVINIRITTSASIGRVTSVGTSRFGYNRFICVSCRKNNLGFNFSTSALTLLLAVGGAGCIFGGFPLTEAVSCGVNILVNIGITASTSVGGVASLGARGSRGNRGILVSRRAYICICVGIAAFASMRGIAFLGTSWICYNRNIAMFFGINRFCFIFSASAGTALFTDGGAGRFQRYPPFTPLVNMSLGLIGI